MSTALMLILKAHLEARKEDRVVQRATSLERSRRHVETDRAVYSHRLTTLVRLQLATYVRTGKWWSDVEDLERLLASLEQGAYEDFIDPEVNALWIRLVAKTIDLARKRRTRLIAPWDVRLYNRVHRAWEDAAKRSFGPLPETPEMVPRIARRRAERRDHAA